MHFHFSKTKSILVKTQNFENSGTVQEDKVFSFLHAILKLISIPFNYYPNWKGRLTLKKPLKILLADENTGNSTLIEEIFNAAEISCKLRRVKSISEIMAYLIFISKPEELLEFPDVILLESGLLYKDGEIWIEKIRSDDRFKNIPMVVLHLFHEEEEHFRYRGLPIDYYLERPVDLFQTDRIVQELRKFVEEIRLKTVRKEILQDSACSN